MENKKILGRRLTVILLAVTMTFFLPVTVQSDVMPNHWNYYATYDFDSLESNSRISAVRVVVHKDGTTVNVDTNLDDTPEYTFTLNEGDMWENDLPTGTHIWSTEELTVHQYDDYQWDYKEVILPAVRFWDNDYYYGGVISFKLGTNYILITAAYDNTYIAIDLNNDGTPDLTNTLNEGQVWVYSKYATTLSGESLPGGRWVGYDTRAGAHMYTTIDNTFTTPGGNAIQVHTYATMQEWFGSAYNIIPTTSLGKEYIFPRVDCINPLYWDRADKMIFVATEPSTTINIDHNHDGTTDVTINLANVGDWDYWPHGSIDNAWSHGAYVSANEAILAFYSSPGGGRYWDGFMSQMVPKLSARSDYWNSNGRSTDARWSIPYIHFFSYEDGTILYRDTDNDGTADFTYNLNFCDGGLKIVASKEGEHFWVDDTDNHHVIMYQRLYYSASDTMSPISYQVLEQQDTIPPGKINDLVSPDLSNTGHIYPTGERPTKCPPRKYGYAAGTAKQYYNHAGWLARGNDYYWNSGKYHLAQDIDGNENDPVYAIADGWVVYADHKGTNWGFTHSGDDANNYNDAMENAGDPNYAYFVKHQYMIEGQTKEFLALYAHVQPTINDLSFTENSKYLNYWLDKGKKFCRLDQIWYYNEYDYNNDDIIDWYDWNEASTPVHLHFGICEKAISIPPTSPWGALGLDENNWTKWWKPNKLPQVTHDFVDPIKWMNEKIPISPISVDSDALLIWTAPADDSYDESSGSVTSYDIRYSKSMITESNWNSATQCTGEPTPGQPGNLEYFIVTGLSTTTKYYFGIKSIDESGNPSELSNIISQKTGGMSCVLECPADLIVIDPDGLQIDKDNNEILGAEYIEIDVNGDGDPDDIINIPIQKIGDYTIIVIPEDDASPTDTYSLTVHSNSGSVVLANNVLILEIPDQPYYIRSNEVQIVPLIDSIIDIDPDTLNLNSTGKWITSYIELPEGYNVSDINISTILLNDTISAELHPTNISDYDNDSIPDLMVKFDRQEVQAILAPGDNVVITVSGKLLDDTVFEGTDYIKVI